ncbi:ANR family transcriptional regulator [Serratia sp. SRS-8-S-2018]|uniref:ANR family transcriptional regulator n=1 Tax=Serratia sp. SRS-8-S-2018 TaxID=2591107 RepID=UPI0015E83F91|nr:ANR family transcriptional regulator [Serratia sp. SRS-8-S-2018]
MSKRDRMTDMPAAEVLPGVSAMSTRQERLRASLLRAAELEREGCFEDAAHCWLMGQALAALESERLWCEARVALCQKRGRQDTESNGGR